MKIFVFDSAREWEKYLTVTKLGILKKPTVPDGSFLVVHDSDWDKKGTGWRYDDLANRESIHVLVISGSQEGAKGDGSSDSESYHCYKKTVHRNLDNSTGFLSALKKLILLLGEDNHSKAVSDWETLYPRSDSNLRALSILCQGYLAAHGGKSLGGWASLPALARENVLRLKEKTEEASWWDVLTADHVDKDLLAELENHSIELAPVTSLINDIKNGVSITEEKVIDVYWLFVNAIGAKDVHEANLAKTKK